MAISISGSSLLVKDGDGPFYTEDSTLPPNIKEDPPYLSPDSNTVNGLAAASMSTIDAATGGTIVVYTAPGQAPPAAVSFLTGTLAYLKANKPINTAICFATDVGTKGSFFLYFNDVTVGDNGFLLLGGS